jgi:hypothetical protein
LERDEPTLTLHGINGDSAGNYQLIDKESTQERVFHRESPAYLLTFRQVRSKCTEILQTVTIPGSPAPNPLKGQSHEIFYPRFFFGKQYSWSPDSWAKAVLNLNSFLRIYLFVKFDSALCCIAWSRLFVVLSKNFLFYFADNM